MSCIKNDRNEIYVMDNVHDTQLLCTYRDFPCEDVIRIVLTTCCGVSAKVSALKIANIPLKCPECRENFVKRKLLLVMTFELL